MPPELPTLEAILTEFEAKASTPTTTKPAVDETVTTTDVAPGTTAVAGVTEAVVETVDPVEAAAEVVAPEVVPVKKDPQAARFAALARREKEARQYRQEAEQRVKDIEAREKAIQERETRLTAAKKHPLELLKEHGYSYADATQAVLGNYKTPEVDPIVSKVDEKLNPLTEQMTQLREAQEQINSSLQELQKHRVEIAQREVRQAIESTAKDNGFDFIVAAGDEAYGLVQDVITAFYQKHKRILNYNEACDRVEKYYQERFDKLAAAPKVQSRFVPSATQSKVTVKPIGSVPVKSAKESKTLTQSLNTSARAKTDIDSLSRNDALAELATRLRYIPD